MQTCSVLIVVVSALQCCFVSASLFDSFSQTFWPQIASASNNNGGDGGSNSDSASSPTFSHQTWSYNGGVKYFDSQKSPDVHTVVYSGGSSPNAPSSPSLQWLQPPKQAQDNGGGVSVTAPPQVQSPAFQRLSFFQPLWTLPSPVQPLPPPAAVSQPSSSDSPSFTWSQPSPSNWGNQQPNNNFMAPSPFFFPMWQPMQPISASGGQSNTGNLFYNKPLFSSPNWFQPQNSFFNNYGDPSSRFNNFFYGVNNRK